MYCKNCGEQINGDMAFCPKCGSSCMSEQKMYGMRESEKNKYIGILTLGICGLLLILSVVKIVGLVAGDYEKIIKKYVKAIEKEDGELLSSLYAPNYIDYMVGEGSFYSSKDNYIEDLTDECEEMHEYLSSGIEKHPDITYTIIQEEKLDKDELDDLNERLEDYYDFKKNSVGKAYYVTFKISIPGGEHCYTCEQYMLKIGTKWYMNRGGLGL